MDIGNDDDPGPITGVITFAERLLVVKGGGIYEAQLADQIDPKRTNPKVPNTQVRLIRYGSDSEFMSRTLLTGDVLINENYLRSGVSRDRLMPIVLALAIKLAQINDLVEEYVVHETAAVEALDRANKQMKGRRSFAIPEVPNVDSSCKSFLIQAKHALQDLLIISGEFFGDALRRGFFSNLQDLARQKYGGDDVFHLFLKETEPLREFVRAARNCIEHEKPNERVIVSNIRMKESAEIVLPTFELVHPKYPQEEVGVGTLLHSVFSNLVEFSEKLLAHMVAKNIDNTKKGFAFDLMQFPEGHRQNPNIRYGFGVMLDGELRPIG